MPDSAPPPSPRASTTAGPRSAPQQGEAAPVVVAQRLTKVFKDFWMRDQVRAVDALDFEIRRGEIFGLIGPNGSGKSTTIKIILGLLHKTSGRITVLGKAPTDIAVKKRIGYLPEDSYLYPFLNARETLEFYGKLFGLGRTVRRRRIDELLEMVGLEAVQNRSVGEFSKGMQRRIGIAQALINDPDFLILDEPTSGLDPVGIRQVKDLIENLGRRGKTILLSSHLLSEVEDVCDRLTILYGGKARASGTCDELLTKSDRTVIETDALDDATRRDLQRLIEERSGHPVLGIRPARQTLEALFLEIVERAQQERAATHGARSGGPTAAFLRGEGDAAGPGEPSESEGEALLERLVGGGDGESADAGADAEAAPDAGPGHAPGEEATSRTGHDAEPDVLRSLLASDDAGSESPEEEPARSSGDEPTPSRPTPREDDDRVVDSGIIDALLDDERDDDGNGDDERDDDSSRSRGS